MAKIRFYDPIKEQPLKKAGPPPGVRYKGFLRSWQLTTISEGLTILYFILKLKGNIF